MACFHFFLDTRGVLRLMPSLRSKNSRMSTAYALLHLKPNGLILGTSADFPLNLEHPGWSEESTPRMYANTSGARFYETFRTLQHSVAIHPPKQIVVSLFFGFANSSIHKDIDFAERRMRTFPNGKNVPYIRWLIQTLPDVHYALFSKDIYEDIYNNIRMRKNLSFIRVKQYGPPAKRKRVKTLPTFLQTFDHNYDRLCDGRDVYNKKNNVLKQFEEMVALIRNNSIDAYFFITPIHARRFSLLQKDECWNVYKHWISGMVDILEKDARANPDKKALLLWDFNGYNSINTECVLPHNQKESQMHWFYDGAHYSPETANLLLDQMFGYRQHDRVVPKDFGVQLSSDMLEKHFASQFKDRKAYLRSRPKNIEEEIKLSLNGDCRQ